jgi:hypothetical protein
MRHAVTLAALLFAACGDSPQPAATGVDESAALPPLAPAIVSPDEAADPAARPSYEVAIASAAAEHNAAKERCVEQPEAVRTQCEQEANAAFAEAQQGLEDLRGNQQ